MSRVHFKHLVIRASAGTGKTFRLTNRYIGLLAAGAVPESILAMTFTRKAAGEINRRVMRRLAEAATDPAKADTLAEQIESSAMTPAQWGTLLCDLVRRAHRVSISTLDGFFIGVAQAFALELNLPPGWTIATEVEDAALRDQAIADVLATHDTRRLIDLVRLMHGGEVRRGVAEQMRGVVTRLHELYLEAPEADSWGWLKAPPGPSPEALADAVDALAKIEPPKTKSGTPNKHWANALAAAREAVTAGDWRSLVFSDSGGFRGLGGAVADGKDDFNRHPIDEAVHAVFKVFVSLVRAEDLGRLAAQNRSVHELLGAFEAQYRRRQFRAHRLLFSDVTRLLAARAASWHDLYYRLDGQVHHLLLDEFQDTSVTQWRVLEPMAKEMTAQAAGERTFFCVGDVKQAIYGWRGGEAALMTGLRSALNETVAEEPLDESHRSSPVIMETVNRVFENIAQSPAMKSWDLAAGAWEQGFAEHRSAPRVADRVGYAELLVAHDAREQVSPRIQALRDAANLTKDLLERAPGRSIGLLVRTNKAVARLIYELKRCDVSASEEGGNPLTDAPAVSLVLSLLRIADHPADTAARFHVAKSPLGLAIGYGDHTDEGATARLGSQIRRQLLSDGYGTTVMSWVEKLAISCDARNLRRLLQLADLAQSHDAHATLRPGDFIEVVRRRRVEDPTSAPVRVMTVHQAKGLEFDAVILPELDVLLSPWQPPPEALTDRPDPTDRAGRVSLPGRSAVRTWSTELQSMAEQHERRAIAESLSMLYVALTRPIHALYLIAPTTDGVRSRGATWADLLCETLTGSSERPVSDRPLWVSPAGDPFWAERVSQSSDEVAEQVLCESDMVLELAPVSCATRRLPRRSASAQEGGGQVDVAALLDQKRHHAMGRGALIHALCECIGWIEDGMPDRSVLLEAAQACGWEGDLDREVEAWTSALRQPAIDAVLRRSAPEMKLYREEPFSKIDGEELVTGVFDRLALTFESGRVTYAHVLDFKTDRVTRESLPERVVFYKPQMQLYRRAVQLLHGLGADQVRVSLVFLDAGEVIDV